MKVNAFSVYKATSGGYSVVIGGNGVNLVKAVAHKSGKCYTIVFRMNADSCLSDDIANKEGSFKSKRSQECA